MGNLGLWRQPVQQEILSGSCAAAGLLHGQLSRADAQLRTGSADQLLRQWGRPPAGRRPLAYARVTGSDPMNLEWEQHWLQLFDNRPEGQIGRTSGRGRGVSTGRI